MGTRCRTDGPCPRSECNCVFYDSEISETMKINSGEYSINDARASVGLPEVPDAEITPGADNFVVLMQKLPGIAERAKDSFVVAGKAFADDFATLGPYMEGLTPEQGRVFLSYLESTMEAMGMVFQSTMEKIFEKL